MLEFNQIWQQFQNELEQQSRKWKILTKAKMICGLNIKSIAERRVRTGLVLAEVGSK